MPGYSRLTCHGRYTPRIPDSYSGYASVQNRTWQSDPLVVHVLGPLGPQDYELLAFGDYIEVPLKMVRELTIYRVLDPEGDTPYNFDIGLLFTSQKVRYRMFNRDGWTEALAGPQVISG